MENKIKIKVDNTEIKETLDIIRKIKYELNVIKRQGVSKKEIKHLIKNIAKEVKAMRK